MPRCPLLRLGEDIHHNGSGLLDVHGLVGGIQLPLGAEFPQEGPSLYACAAVWFDEEDRLTSLWDVAFQWWHGTVLRAAVRTLETGPVQKIMCHAAMPGLSLDGPGIYELRFLCRAHRDGQADAEGWTPVLATYPVEVKQLSPGEPAGLPK